MYEQKFTSFLSRNKLENKPFQTECFKWCISKEQAEQPRQAEQPQQADEPRQADEPEQRKGGILALEMGLGKTIIMIGLIKCNIKKRTLIVLPRSLLEQWEKNIINLCACKPLIYHGSHPKNMKMSLAEIQAASQIVITTYGQVSMPSPSQVNKGRRRSLLHDIEWDRLICDEAHHVSHKKTNEFQGVKALKVGICWLVTGTPIQNNENELYSLYSLLGKPDGKTYYDTGENYNAVARDLVFYSTKADVCIALPPLNQHFIALPWETESEQEFSSHLHSMLEFCHVPKKIIAQQINDMEDKKTLHMRYMAKALKVCCYPPMLKNTISHFDEMLRADKSNAYPNVVPAELYLSQNKVNQVVQKLIDRKANGCGKIVFCHYYAEIDAYAECLRAADPNMRIALFDGRVPASKRNNILQTPVDILLAQIKMCREGLNLQEHYSEVYLPSPHFNPAIEQQAIARCWRMGQKKPVDVFRWGVTPGGNPPHPPSVENDGGNEEEYPSEGDEEGFPTEATGGVGGATPQTMDMYATFLHSKKREFVERLAGNAVGYINTVGYTKNL